MELDGFEGKMEEWSGELITGPFTLVSKLHCYWTWRAKRVKCIENREKQIPGFSVSIAIEGIKV